MKLAIIGSRNFHDYNLLETFILNNYTIEHLIIVSGGADGADTLAAKFAKAQGLQIITFYPNWKKHQRSAGIMRNKKIIEAADEVIAFWDGISKGTANAMNLAKKKNKKTTIIHYNEKNDETISDTNQ